jgi:hypothetical protein
MTDPKWWLVLPLTFALCTSYCAGYDTRHFRDTEVPKEVLSAKTIAIIARVIGAPASPVAEYKTRIESSALAEIQKGNRFQGVADPSKADLVCLMIVFSDGYWRESFSQTHGFMERNRALIWMNIRPEAIIVLKGGNYAERDARPVWMKTSYHSPVWKKNHEATPNWMMKDFLEAFEKAERKNPSDDEHEPAVPEPADEAAGGDSAAAGTDPANRRQVFCPFHQQCSIPRELYSARNVLICDPIHSCNDKQMQKYVQWGGRWRLVDDGAQADLVLVICATPSRVEQRKRYFFSSLYVFKGGRQPAWDSLLLYTLFDTDDERALKRFQKFVFEAH